MDELWDTSKPDVKFKSASVSFPGFEFYRDKAEDIAAYIDGIEVTEENVKEVKKELAKARKLTDELSSRRVAIKREVLKDFDVFEGQVKEISGIVSEAETKLRIKVKTLEEEERCRKKDTIFEIWDKRVHHYTISEYKESHEIFEWFLTPQMLNKSTSVNEVENEIIEFLEQTEKDLKVAETIDYEVIINYLGCFDLAKAISQFNEHEEVSRKIAASKDEDDEPKYALVITGDKECKFAELLLNENNIEYEKRRM